MVTLAVHLHLKHMKRWVGKLLHKHQHSLASRASKMITTTLFQTARDVPLSCGIPGAACFDAKAHSRAPSDGTIVTFGCQAQQA